MARRYIIYGLVDPRTRELRYVGRSSSGMDRPRQHACPSLYTDEKLRRLHRYCWIRLLADRGLRPEIVVLGTTTRSRLCPAERAWIARLKKVGARLTNHSAGGDGPKGFSHRPETKERLRQAMLAVWKRRGELGRRRQSTLAKARWKDPEYRERCLRGAGWHHTRAVKRTIAAKRRGWRPSERTLARMSRGQRRRYAGGGR